MVLQLPPIPIKNIRGQNYGQLGQFVSLCPPASHFIRRPQEQVLSPLESRQKNNHIKSKPILHAPFLPQGFLKLICNCHCLLLPTHAECAGIVFSEASAFGLPSFAYDTGGISNYVINGKNGYRLSPDSTAVDFAHTIESAINTNEFKQLHDGALSHYKEKVSWKAWSKRFSGF